MANDDHGDDRSRGLAIPLLSAAIAAVIGSGLAVVSGVALTSSLAGDTSQEVTTPLVRYDG